MREKRRDESTVCLYHRVEQSTLSDGESTANPNRLEGVLSRQPVCTTKGVDHQQHQHIVMVHLRREKQEQCSESSSSVTNCPVESEMRSKSKHIFIAVPS